MNFALVSVLKANYSVSMLCDVLELSPSGYYAWRRRGQSSGRRLAGRATRHEAMRQSFLRSKGRYGSPRVHRDLRSKGLRVSRRAVAEFMRREGLCARKRRPFKATTDSKHVDPIAPNLLDRNFTVVRPNVAWVTSRRSQRGRRRLAFPCRPDRPPFPTRCGLVHKHHQRHPARLGRPPQRSA